MTPEKKAEVRFVGASTLDEKSRSALLRLPKSLRLSILSKWVEMARTRSRVNPIEWNKALAVIRQAAMGRELDDPGKMASAVANAAPDGWHFTQDRKIGYAISEVLYIASDTPETNCRHKNVLRLLSESAGSPHDAARMKVDLMAAAAEQCRLFGIIGERLAECIYVPQH